MTDFFEAIGITKKPIEFVTDKKNTITSLNTTNIDFQLQNAKKNEYIIKVKFKSNVEQSLSDFKCEFYVVRRPQNLNKNDFQMAFTKLSSDVTILPNQTYGLTSEILKLEKPSNKLVQFYLVIKYIYSFQETREELYEYFKVVHSKIGLVEDYIPNADEMKLIRKYSKEIIELK